MEQSLPVSRPVALVTLVVVVVLAGAGTLALSTVASDPVAAGATPQTLVEPKPGENVFWPYTSRQRSPSGRTLAINVVVYADVETVRFSLTERVDATWNETAERWQDVDPDEGQGEEVDAANRTVVEWAAARGAKRYLYVHSLSLTEERPNSTTRRPYRALPFVTSDDVSGGGQWIDETDQFHDGEYFGSRYHLRLYESPYESDEWVAIQAHSDHWDWFRLRHTVHDTEGAQNHVESAFMADPSVDAVWRMHLDNPRGVGSDGWATVVDFSGESNPAAASAAGLAVGAFVTARRRGALGAAARRLRRAGCVWCGRRDGHAGTTTGGSVLKRVGVASMPRSWDRLDHRQYVVAMRALSYGILFAVLLCLYLSVRAGGVFLEGEFRTVSPKAIAAALYPVVAFGLPVAAYTFGRGLESTRSFAVAAVAVWAAVLFDYRYLGVTVLPLDVVVHRIGIAVALGLLAAGATYRDAPVETVNRQVAAGVLLWTVLLVAPLVGWL